MLHERCHTGPRKKKSIKFGPTLSAMYPHLINCLNCSIFFKWFKCISHSSVDTLKLNVIFTPILTYKHNIPFVFLSEIGPFFSRVTLSLTKSDIPRYCGILTGTTQFIKLWLIHGLYSVSTSSRAWRGTVEDLTLAEGGSRIMHV